MAYVVSESFLESAVNRNYPVTVWLSCQPREYNYMPADLVLLVGSITLLFQRLSQAGLEIQTSNGEWCSVPVAPEGYDPEPSAKISSNHLQNDDSPHSRETADPIALPPILLNIGDLLSYWTNGLLPSTVHRVVVPKAAAAAAAAATSATAREIKSRYSIAYFCHPANDTPLETVPSDLVPKRSTTAAVKSDHEAGSPMTAKQHLMQRLEATYGFKHE